MPRLLSASLCLCLGLAAQIGPNKPIFTDPPVAGERAGTQRWIVHFCTAPYSLAPYREEMWGNRDPERVERIVAKIESDMRAGRARFTDSVESLGGKVIMQWWIVNALLIEIEPQHLTTIRTLDNVDFLQPDAIVSPAIKDSTSSRQHNSDALQAKNNNGLNIGLAIIDASFADNINNTSRPHITFSKRGSRTQHRIVARQRIGQQPFQDNNPHGTGVAAIAGGWSWFNSFADRGHAPDAPLSLFAIADDGFGNSTVSKMAQAYNSVAALAARFKIRVTNLSYEGTTASSDPRSVEQKAMDSAARNADLLNCTGSGNSGGSVVKSLANINGISVGAVNPENHALFNWSGRGRQGGRYFPNMVAVGFAIMPWSQDESRLYVTQGTSFSSPHVCGGAALIYNIYPTMRSDEMRAVILASSMPVAGTGSTIEVVGAGAGFLKIDAAEKLALNGNQRRRTRATVSAQNPRWHRSVPVSRGQLLQSAIAWHRNENSTTWPNLDLALLRGNVVLVDSNSGSNTEELVRWRATRTENLVLRVTHVSGSAQTFGFASTSDTFDAAGSYSRVGTGCAGSAGVPVLDHVGAPGIGSRFEITVSSAKSNTPALLYLGNVANTSLPGGCRLLATTDLLWKVLVTDSRGRASASVGIPYLVPLLRQKFSNQWWVLDDRGALLGLLALSNGGQGTIGF